MKVLQVFENKDMKRKITVFDKVCVSNRCPQPGMWNMCGDWCPAVTMETEQVGKPATMDEPKKFRTIVTLGCFPGVVRQELEEEQ